MTGTRKGELARGAPRAGPPAEPVPRRWLPAGPAEERLAVGGLLFILVVTAAWWSLALWPMPPSAPGWLERAQAVCFNLDHTGLPAASGWLLLIGQPAAMGVALLVLAGRPLAAGMRKVVGTTAGRVSVASASVFVAVGLAAAAVRVAGALGPVGGLAVLDLPAEDHPRLQLDLPPFALVDQHGAQAGPERIRGRPALVTFAFGHCETLCPLVVKSALEARRGVEGETSLTIVVITLDPWRDTPDRLARMAGDWGLAEGDLVLGGSAQAVEAALDAWDVPRSRDLRTGDVQHAPLVYLIDADGRVAFRVRGDAATLVALTRRL